MSSGNLNFTINIGGNVFSGVAQIDALMNNLTATIEKQETFWKKISQTSFRFNAVLQSVKTIAAGVRNTLNGFESTYNIQAAAEAKLAQVMRNTMNASDDEVESIKRLAAEQQKLGIISSEIQVAGAQELGTYLSKSASLKALMPVMNDMVAQQYGYNASQEQAVQIGSMMGKVMDGQVGALSRYGYKFTEAQEKILKYGNEQQRVATLAQVVSASVGGMNAALASTNVGQAKQRANEMDAIKQRVGKMYVDIQGALAPVFDKLHEKINTLVGWFENNFDTISTVCMGVATTIGVAFDVVANIVGGTIDVFKWLYDVVSVGYPIMAGLGVAIGGLAIVINAAAIKTAFLTGITKAWTVAQGVAAGATKIWTGAQAILNAVMTANPIGVIIALVAGLVTGVALCWNKFAGFRAVILTVWDTVKGFGGVLKTFVLDRITGIIEGVGALGSAIAKLFKGDFSGAWDAAKTGVVKITGVEAVSNAFNGAKETVQGTKAAYSKNLENEQAKDAEKKAAKEGVEAGDDLTLGLSKKAGSPIGGALAGIGETAAKDNAGKIKNINVVIERVVDTFNINTTNLREDLTRVKQMVAEVLTSSVNDLNYVV